jgi:hypothetical protein
MKRARRVSIDRLGERPFYADLLRDGDGWWGRAGSRCTNRASRCRASAPASDSWRRGCSVLGLSLTPARRTRLEAMGVAELEALVEALRRTKRWPRAGR